MFTGICRFAAGPLVCCWLAIAGYSQPAPPAAYPGGTNINYIRTWEAVRPDSDPDHFNTGSPPGHSRMTTQYFDGLGRPLQTVIKQGSLATGAEPTDLVSPVVYDAFGREVYKYLPFAANNTGGNASVGDGQFKLNPFQQQVAFYNTQLSGQAGETNTGSGQLNWAYSQAVFEPSPLNRVSESFAPGVSWAGTAGQSNEADRRSVKVSYWFNMAADEVKKWRAMNNPGGWAAYEAGGFYPANELYKNITADEHGRQTIEYKDKEGLVILKKVQLTAAADEGAGSGYDGWLCTYYIYDGLNRLRCVIQPVGVKWLAENGWPALTHTILNEQCFRYEYDHRSRLIIKKVPGAGEVYMVYDARDRLVMTQDANLREAGKWMVTKYDGLNRPVETGLWVSYTAAADHRIAAAGSIAYPATSSNYDVLTIAHYDDYTGIPGGFSSSFDGSWSAHFYGTYNAPPLYAQPQAASSLTKGMVTWTQTQVPGANTFLSTVNIYDDKGRVIQVKATNLLGKDIITTQYDWPGKPLITVQSQQIMGDGAQTTVIVTRLSYDDLGRLVKTENKLGNTHVSSGAMADYVTTSTLQYDALGQLKTKTIGSKKDGNTHQYLTPREPLQELTYDYTIRGWLLGMNRDYLATQGQTGDGVRFGFELGYDKTASKTGESFDGQQFNGNIAGMAWKSDGDDIRRKYDFGYDGANRLLRADFKQQNDDDGLWNNQKVNFSVKMGDGIDPTLAYDANGNILRMQQWGLKPGGSEQIDDLRYAYFAGGNKLQKVDDWITADQQLGDFTDKNTGTDYGYDKNGNLVTDLNKRIGGATGTGTDITSGGAISYNHLNLPVEIQVKDDDGNNKGKITYTYDAAGNKLRKETVEYASAANNHITITSTTDYVNGFVYESKTDNDPNTADYIHKLQFLGMEEGRIRFREAQGATPAGFEYDYMIKDHLGNVRMVLTEETKTDGYLATTETGVRSTEEQLFSNIPETESDKPEGFDGESDNQKVSRLLCRTDEDKRIGPGVVLKVMAGDRFKAGVMGWYAPDITNPNPGPATIPMVQALINAFTGGLPAGSNHGQGSGQTPGSAQLAGPLQDFIDNHNPVPPGIIPRAYLNWILLDAEQFKLVQGNYGSVQIPEITGVMERQPMLANGGEDIEVKKNGYLYVYVSNESKGSVFFDNLQVVHTRGPVLEETHYYPFGLTMKGISSRALAFGNPENRYKFNDGTELASKEFIDGSGLELYETPFRGYDPQLGRFWQIDAMADDYENWTPYAFSLNNPIFFNDPTGLTTEPSKETSTLENPKELGEVVLTASTKNKWDYSRWAFFADMHKGLDHGRLTNHLIRQGVDERGLRLFNQAWGAIGYRERLAEIEAGWRAFVEAALLEGATWVAGGIVMKVGSKLVAIGYRAYKLNAVRTGIANSRALGIAGEQAVGVGSKTRIPSLTGTAKYRIPDQLTSTTLGEVKNVSHLGLTRQLTDFHMFSQQTGRQFILHTRPNTTFSAPLQNLINNGSIIAKPIPFK